MRTNRLMKQSLAVLLSVCMSLGPCAFGILPVFAETGGAEINVEILEAEGFEETNAARQDPADLISEAVTESTQSKEETVSASEVSIASNSDAQTDEDGFLLDGEVIDNVNPDTATSADADPDLLPESVLLDAELLEASGDLWYQDYDYELGDGIITLKTYLGGEDDIVVPAAAMIDGERYAIVINGSGCYRGSSITSVVFEDGVTLGESADRMFAGCSKLTSADLSGLNTSQVKSMYLMFFGCSGLTELDLSGFDTSQVTDMEGMFLGCSGLTKLDLSGFDTSRVTNMNNMFGECTGLTELNLSSFNTSQVTDISMMFWRCSGLTELDVSGFDTSHVIYMASAFEQCPGLTKLDVGGFDTSRVTNMNSMFYGCQGLTELGLGSFDTSQVTDMEGMFFDCPGLTELNLSSFDTSQVINMNWMFEGCSGLTKLDLSSFDMSQVTDMDDLFNACESLEELRTPVNLMCDAGLPLKMYDESGKEYSKLPTELDHSIILLNRIPVKSIALNETEKILEAGETLQLRTEIRPDNANNKTVTWTSSNVSVAAVNEEGLVTAKMAGTAVITVRTEDGGKTASCTVTVKAKDPAEEFLKRLYTSCLDREADAGGLNYWKERIDSGNVKGIALAGEFVFSKEFTGKNYCNEHFVRQLYSALMGRDPASDPSGVKYWISVLDKGTTREALLNSFTSSAEYKKLCAEAGIELGSGITVPKYGTQQYGPCIVCGEKSKVVQFVERMYTECLKRAAESSGLTYWSKELCNHTKSGKTLLDNFFLSNEIKNKNLSNEEYVRRIYRAMLNRDPDSGGLEYWKGRLDKGDSPTAVIAGFVDSAEFTKICQDYGIQRK